MGLYYYKNLDGIRAFAALMVITCHFFQMNTDTSIIFENLKKIAVFGQTGVDLFFVLSGFLITRILINTKGEQGYFKNFYARRTLRIFPLYYLFLFIYYFLYPYIFSTNSISFNQQIYFYTYLQNFSDTFNWSANGPAHYWSLAVEEHFYLFWPVLVFYLNKINLLKIIFLLFIVAFLTRIYLLSNGYSAYYLTFARFDALAIGGLLALKEKNIFSPRLNSMKILSALFFFLTITLFLGIKFSGGQYQLYSIFKYSLYAIIYFLIILFFIRLKTNHILNTLLLSKPLQFLGKISYGLYVYHLFIIDLTNLHLSNLHWIPKFFLSIILTIIISSMSFYFFERKFLTLKRYFEFSKTQSKESVIPLN